MWELGGGIGHLTRLAPVARALMSRGHTVTAFLRNPARAPEFFADVPCREIPLPRLDPAKPIGVRGFADLLRLAGWFEGDGRQALFRGWTELFEREQPDAVVFDHAPTALLTSQGRPVRRILLGNGYSYPPNVEPLPVLQPGTAASEADIETERTALAFANEFLESTGEPPLPRLAALFQRVDAHLLATWPELDHYGAREGADYVGVWTDAWGEGAAPRWPAGGRARVFGYVKPFPALPALVKMLDRPEVSSLLYLNEAGPEISARLATPRVRIVSEPVRLADAAADCDVAVLNASHGTTAALLLAGRPVLAIPLQLEQFLVARCVVQARAGQLAANDAPDQIAEGLRRILGDARFRSGAAAFARRRVEFDPAAAVTSVADRIERLARSA